MPRKVFVAGEILTAADVNTNLMDQAVMTFAGTAARGSAIASPSEGMVTYLEDTDQLEVYGGTAVGWSSASNFLFGTATPSEGQVATFSTAVSGYVPADAGKVLQVVQGTHSVSETTSSTSFVNTSLAVTITPSSATSKILILCAVPVEIERTATTTGDSYFRVANAGVQMESHPIFGDSTSNGKELRLSISISAVDSPATTSAKTYTFQQRALQAQTVTSFRGNVDLTGYLIAMEIAG